MNYGIEEAKDVFKAVDKTKDVYILATADGNIDLDDLGLALQLVGPLQAAIKGGRKTKSGAEEILIISHEDGLLGSG